MPWKSEPGPLSALRIVHRHATPANPPLTSRMPLHRLRRTSGLRRDARRQDAARSTDVSALLDAIAVSGLLIERLGELGVDVGAILARAGLPASRFVAGGKLTTREFFDLWRAVDAEPGARDLGIRLAAGRRASQYDVASAAALRSADLAEAIRRFARYKRLSCPEHVRVEVARSEASLR